jgi:hypothetical protein
VLPLGGSIFTHYTVQCDTIDPACAHFVSPNYCLQEESHRDPDLIVLWTTQEWADWPRGLSKTAARVMIDPLFLFTVMAPIWILAFNVACKQESVTPSASLQQAAAAQGQQQACCGYSACRRQLVALTYSSLNVSLLP